VTENDNVVWLQPEEDGLEPLGRHRSGRGIDATTKAIFDVLYEADEPLHVDVLVERTFDRVHPAVHYHARRRYVRKLESDRLAKNRATESDSVARNFTTEKAWWYFVKEAARQSAYSRYGVLLRDGDVYRPNPEKPPRVQQADGSLVKYTRDAWLALTARDRAVGEVQTMRMETNRVFGSLTREELEHTLQLAAHDFATPRPRNSNAASNLRRRVGWLLDRPTTDAGRAWLLQELVRRIYGLPPDM